MKTTLLDVCLLLIICAPAAMFLGCEPCREPPRNDMPPGYFLQTDGVEWRYVRAIDGATLVHGNDKETVIRLAWDSYRDATNEAALESKWH